MANHWEEDYCMTIYVALPPEGIFKVPLVEVALDEVVPEYDLMAIADGENDMLIINFCQQYEEMVHRAVRLVYGEPLSVEDLPNE